MYSIYKSMEIIETKIVDFNVEGWPIPVGATITFRVTVNNPTEHSVTIEKLYYEIYVEDTFLASGSKEYITIFPGQAHINLDVHVTTQDALRTLAIIISEGGKEIHWKIRGVVRIPIKLFNMVKIASIDIPYEAKGTYSLSTW